MSGHSKWHNIRRKKEANDAKKGKIFSKMSRLITVAARSGGDLGANPNLRLAVDKAKAAKMPKENIDRAILKGTGNLPGSSFEEVVYEGFGPEGVAFYLKGLTDNKNRTVAEVRTIFERNGGSMGAQGSTSYIFNDPQNPSFEIEITDKDKLVKVIALVDTFEDHDDIQEVFANFSVPQNLEDQL